MAIPFVVGTPTTAATNVTNPLILNKPTGVQDGDVLVFAWRSQESGNNPAGITVPAGFSKLGVPLPNPIDASSRHHGFWAKAVSNAATEPSTYTFNSTGSGRRVGLLFIVRGVDIATMVAGYSTPYTGTTLGAYGRRAASHATEIPSLSLFLGGAEFPGGTTHIPTLTPANYTEYAYSVQPSNDPTMSQSRTLAWVGYKEMTTSPTSHADMSWASSSSPMAETVELHGTDETPFGAPIRLGNGSIAGLSVSIGNERLVPDSLKVLRPGFANVTQMLATAGATWAHRGGSAHFPEMSQYAYDQSVLRGYGALEFSAQRTSDGIWFGMHDNDFDRATGMIGTSIPAATSWATVQSYQNTIHADGHPRPFWTLTDFLDKWTPTHVVLADPKNQLLHTTEFLDVLDAHGGPGKIVVKYYGVGSGSINLANAAAARGYQTWGYFYDTDYTNGDFEANWSSWSLLGMNIEASQSIWDAVVAKGRPVVGHIAQNQTDYSMAIAKGASMVQCAATMSILPVSV